MKILLPIDGSTASLEAIHHATQLVQAGLQASFVLANVQAPANFYELVSTPDAASLEEVSQAAGAHALAQAQALMQGAGLDFESEVASGDPGNVLVEIAERYGCDMVIMQTGGAGELRQALLGSVSHSVVHGAHVPVTLVNTRAR
ncbi:universal stress protein [Variovorax ginsengisoli]|uniref:Nucleotide-binding universal stress UspA family protein n=1 Tax=Variovorax ginsengisoli TaxID=363844 RepID=A0ABT9S476_9BURK|nr:universal stress protein [Variovorax ginsengisoli]MDP9899153.1 nucleotide-binding universal stress UspA family protein [Variovorax ginsengisoli]